MARPIALITGASSGIGAALAREVAKDGYDVVLSARRVEPMQALAGELESYGASATILAADLSKSGNAPDLVREINQHGMAVDLLINNAGLGDNGAFAESETTRIGEMLQVNIVALTELTRLILPAMIARKRGRVMLLASTASFQPGPQMAVYCATKAYVLSLGEAIDLRAAEFRRDCDDGLSRPNGHRIFARRRSREYRPESQHHELCDEFRGGRAHRLSGDQSRPPRGDHWFHEPSDGDGGAYFAARDGSAHRELDDVDSLMGRAAKKRNS